MKKIVLMTNEDGTHNTMIEVLQTLYPECEVRVVLRGPREDRKPAADFSASPTGPEQGMEQSWRRYWS